jgi:hypothetical protein
MGQHLNYKLLFNTGILGSNYQAGHAHADAFTFTLTVDSCPLIVDRGVSTYNDNEIRRLEKGTSAHNTLSVDSANSAALWSSFRMAKRPSVFCLSKDLNLIDYNKIIEKVNYDRNIITKCYIMKTAKILKKNITKEELYIFTKKSLKYFDLDYELFEDMLNNCVEKELLNIDSSGTFEYI